MNFLSASAWARWLIFKQCTRFPAAVLSSVTLRPFNRTSSSVGISNQHFLFVPFPSFNMTAASFFLALLWSELQLNVRLVDVTSLVLALSYIISVLQHLSHCPVPERFTFIPLRLSVTTRLNWLGWRYLGLMVMMTCLKDDPPLPPCLIPDLVLALTLPAPPSLVSPIMSHQVKKAIFSCFLSSSRKSPKSVCCFCFVYNWRLHLYV